MGAVCSGTWPISGARGEIHHEICLFPTVFLKRPTQFFVGPDQLQHLAGPPNLTVRVLAVGRRSIHTFALRITNSWTKTTQKHLTSACSQHTYPSLLMSTSLSMPCEARRVFAASRLLPKTSASVLSTDTTVSSERARPDWLWPPGKFATRLGTACKPYWGKNKVKFQTNLQMHTHLKCTFQQWVIWKRILFITPEMLSQTDTCKQWPYQVVRSCGCRWQGSSRRQTLPELHGHCHEPKALPSWEGPSPDALWPVYIDHTEDGKRKKNKTKQGLFQKLYSDTFTVEKGIFFKKKALTVHLPAHRFWMAPAAASSTEGFLLSLSSDV